MAKKTKARSAAKGLGSGMARKAAKSIVNRQTRTQNRLARAKKGR